MWGTELLGSIVTDSGVVVLRYRGPAFAEPTAGGALRSGEFTAAYGYRNLDGLGADRLTVVAPPGMRVDRPVPGASVARNGTRMTLTAFDRGALVTFVPRDSALGPVLSLVALAALVGPGGSGLVAVGGGVVAVSLVGTVLGAGGTATTGVGIGVTLLALGGALTRRSVHEGVTYWRLCCLASLCVALAAGVVLALVPVVSLFAPVGGFGVFVVPFALGTTVAGLVFGTPLLIVGAALGRTVDSR